MRDVRCDSVSPRNSRNPVTETQDQGICGGAVGIVRTRKSCFPQASILKHSGSLKSVDCASQTRNYRGRVNARDGVKLTSLNEQIDDPLCRSKVHSRRQYWTLPRV